MATLNIKNFPDPLYRALQEQAKREHRSLAQETIHLLQQRVPRPPTRSLLNFRGLANGAGMGNAAERIRQERDSWDS